VITTVNIAERVVTHPWAASLGVTTRTARCGKRFPVTFGAGRTAKSSAVTVSADGRRRRRWNDSLIARREMNWTGEWCPPSQGQHSPRVVGSVASPVPVPLTDVPARVATRGRAAGWAGHRPSRADIDDNVAHLALRRARNADYESNERESELCNSISYAVALADDRRTHRAADSGTRST